MGSRRGDLSELVMVDASSSDSERRVGEALWLTPLAAGCLLVALFFALPAGGWLQTAVFVGVAFSASGLLAVRLFRQRLVLLGPWRYLVLATGLYALATPFWGFLPLATGQDLPFPSLLDAVYFASYGFAVTFLVGVIRDRYRGERDSLRGAVVALLDAGIFAVAATALLWPTVIGPGLGATGVAGPAQVVGLGYPLLTAVLVGLVARLVISGEGRTPAQWLLLVWAGGELAGDIAYGHLSATGDFYHGHPVSLAWLLSYAALAALALHPDLERLTDEGASVPLAGWRLWVPLVAVVLPGVMALTTQDVVLHLLAGAGVLLIVVRFRLLSGDLAEQRRLADELSALTRRFQHLSLHDPLTGLGNRGLFAEQLDTAWAQQQRHQRGLAVLAVDLDEFKAVNDQLGHEAGDQLLLEVAGRLRRCVRDGDTLARLGGDEFAIVLPDAGVEEAREVAERIHGRLARPPLLPDDAPAVAASIGISVAADRHTSAEDLLREADKAMYVAKGREGSAQHEVYVPGIEDANNVVIPEVATTDARAWADYVQGLRHEIADRKEAGALPSRTRAPDEVHRTLQRVLAAIDHLPDEPSTATLVLPARQTLEEFVFHQTAVQHWTDVMVERGVLESRRPSRADRFWQQLEEATTVGEDWPPAVSRRTTR
jgi:diguanylate cyclase (GGDEF)-like protein